MEFHPPMVQSQTDHSGALRRPDRSTTSSVAPATGTWIAMSRDPSNTAGLFSRATGDTHLI